MRRVVLVVEKLNDFIQVRRQRYKGVCCMRYVHTVTVGYPDVGLHKGSGDPQKRFIQYNISMILSGNVVSIKLPFTFTELSKESRLCMTLP